MSIPNQTNITATLIEKELFKVDISEKDIITVNFTTVDILYKTDEVSIPLWIYNERPTEINSKLFRTTNEYRIGTLRVFLNGIKLNSTDMIEVSSTTFTIPIAKIATDSVECSYIKPATS